MRDQFICLAVKLAKEDGGKVKHALIEVPTDAISCFLILTKALNDAEQDIKIVPEIYGGGLATQISVLHSLPHEYWRLFWVGHNPDISELAARLLA